LARSGVSSLRCSSEFGDVGPEEFTPVFAKHSKLFSPID